MDPSQLLGLFRMLVSSTEGTEHSRNIPAYIANYARMAAFE